MKICAIVLNYRNAARTQACLDSLSNQGLDTVLVVDNSEDRRFEDELAAMLVRRSGLVDYRLQLINPGSNLGFACGVNLALKEADALHCDAFLLINNDAIASPGMVGHLNAALADPEVVMVAPQLVDVEGQAQPAFWYQRYFGLLTTRSWPGSFPYLSGCCLLFRKELVVDGKLFDEDFFMYGEDTMLGWRLVRAGKVFCRANRARVQHVGGGSSQQGGLFYEYHTVRAHVLLALKTNHNRIEIPLLLMLKSAGLAWRALSRSVRFGSVVPLLAFILAWFPMKIHARL